MLVLQIVVDAGCSGCETARNLAAELSRLAPPGVAVDLVDLSDPRAERPEAVFAVPTYLLGGRIISLGNPDPAWLVDLIGRHAGSTITAEQGTPQSASGGPSVG